MTIEIRRTTESLFRGYGVIVAAVRRDDARWPAVAGVKLCGDDVDEQVIARVGNLLTRAMARDEVANQFRMPPECVAILVTVDDLKGLLGEM